MRALLVVAALALGCSRGEKLEGAVSGIPVYSPAEVEDRGKFFADDGALKISLEGLRWKLRTGDDWRSVDAFYASRLPQAVRKEDTRYAGRADEVVFDWMPDGFDPVEHVTIRIHPTQPDGKTRFEIEEVVRKGRR